MYEDFKQFITNKTHLCVIQAENPDGDSLGSALSIEALLPNKQISQFCPVNIPKYLRYFQDWSKISNEIDYQAEGYIIVDTAAKILLSKLLDDLTIKNLLYTKPVFVIDHHETLDDLDFPHQSIIELLPSCTNLIYKIATELNISISKTAAEYLFQGLLSDTLGLTSAGVTSDTFRLAAELEDYGADISILEEKRKEFMKKSPRILSYKADLIKRIDYSLDGQLSTIHIPWEEIQEYSDEYNPNVLILEEMKMVEGVKVAIAIKTYPDGKLTGKIRSSLPIADKIAGFFGGGGHPFAAGFRTYDTSYQEILHELISCCLKLINDSDTENTSSETTFIGSF